MKSKRFVIIAILFVFIVVGCATQSNEVPTETTALTTTPQATTAPTLTSTPLPTDTPVPMPTPTATVSYPVRSGTAIPELDLPVIGLENAEKLCEIARWGKPRYSSELPLYPRDCDWFIPVVSADGNYFAGVSDVGQIKIWNGNSIIQYSMDIPIESIPNYRKERFNNSYYSMSLSKDGKYLAITDPECDLDNSPENCRILVIDWAKNETIKSLPGKNAFFSPGGKYLIVYHGTFNNKFDFIDVRTWELVFYQIFNFGEYNFESIKVSPNDSYFVFVKKSGVTVYQTKNFLTNLSITNFKTYYPPDAFFSSEENILHVISSYPGEPPEWYTFDISNGELIFMDYFEDMGFSAWVKKIQELSACSYLRRGEESLSSMPEAHFNETLLQDSGLLVEKKENGIFVRIKNNKIDISGFVRNVWNNQLIMSTNYDNTPHEWRAKIIGFFDLGTGNYVEIDSPDLVDDAISSLSLIEGTKWMVFNKIKYSREGMESNIIIYDSETKKLFSTQKRLDKKKVLYYPLEKWNAVGFLDTNNCTNFINLGKDQQGPEKTCLEMEKASYSSEKETVSSIATEFDGKLVVIGTSIGNLFILNNDSGEYAKIKIIDSEITDIAISENGSMISTYSYEDNYTITQPFFCKFESEISIVL